MKDGQPVAETNKMLPDRKPATGFAEIDLEVNIPFFPATGRYLIAIRNLSKKIAYTTIRGHMRVPEDDGVVKTRYASFVVDGKKRSFQKIGRPGDMMHFSAAENDSICAEAVARVKKEANGEPSKGGFEIAGDVDNMFYVFNTEANLLTIT